MPNYDYVCQSCGHIKTLNRQIAKRDDLAVCEKCGHEAKRLFGATSNIYILQSFFTNRSDVLPPKDDKEAWSKLVPADGRGSYD